MLGCLPTAAAELVSGLGAGRMGGAAYDTAWVARASNALRQPAVVWLLGHQHADGSWGGTIEHTYDRVLSTLAAVVALASRPESRGAHASRIERGCRYLERAMWRLPGDPRPEPVAFELIAPRLIADARQLGLAAPDLPPEVARRALNAPHNGRELDVYSPAVAASFSLEMLGEGLDPSRGARLLGATGSIAASPAATAAFLLHGPSRPAEQYLALAAASTPDGSLPTVYPFDLFETAWVLFNFAIGQVAVAHCPAAFGRLTQAWCLGRVGWSSDVPIQDADDLAVVFTLLDAAGLAPDPRRFEPYEREGHFATLPMEHTPSVSTNAHVLHALWRAAEFPARTRWIQKIRAYLRDTQQPDGSWCDKWHLSPYYATAHAIFALADVDDEAVRRARRWLRDSRNSSGLWGVGEGTPEETAYAIQGLVFPSVGRASDPVAGPADLLLDAVPFLLDAWRGSPQHPEQWIAKVLFAPDLIIESALISALQLCALGTGSARRTAQEALAWT